MKHLLLLLGMLSFVVSTAQFTWGLVLSHVVVERGGDIFHSFLNTEASCS